MKNMNKEKKQLRLLLLGTRKLGFLGLKTIVEQGFNIVWVVTRILTSPRDTPQKSMLNIANKKKFPFL